jgi:hypothetical protein
MFPDGANSDSLSKCQALFIFAGTLDPYDFLFVRLGQIPSPFPIYSGRETRMGRTLLNNFRTALILSVKEAALDLETSILGGERAVVSLERILDITPILQTISPACRPFECLVRKTDDSHLVDPFLVGLLDVGSHDDLFLD